MSPHRPTQDSTGPSTPAPARRPLVVLAGKDEETRRALRTILETWNLEVTEAGSCSEAPEVACGAHPDLILLDAAIPFTESLEAAATLRNRALTGDTPVLIISEFSQPPFREAARAQGVADYLTKPCSLEQLHDTVLKLLQRQPGPQPPLRTHHNRPRIRPNSVL